MVEVVFVLVELLPCVGWGTSRIGWSTPCVGWGTSCDVWGSTCDSWGATKMVTIEYVTVSANTLHVSILYITLHKWM